MIVADVPLPTYTVALSVVELTNVLLIFAPVKLMMAPFWKPEPVRVSATVLFAGMGFGETAVIDGPAGSMLTYITPMVLLSEANASISVLTVGTVAGAL